MKTLLICLTFVCATFLGAGAFAQKSSYKVSQHDSTVGSVLRSGNSALRDSVRGVAAISASATIATSAAKKDSVRNVAAISASATIATSAATKDSLRNVADLGSTYGKKDSVRKNTDSLRNVAAVVPTWLKVTSSATVRVDTVALGTPDTLRLGASGVYSWIKLRGWSGTTDSVTAITGGVSGQLYIFSAAADDTTIHINDGGNIKAAAQLVLDALTDRVIFFFDGTNFIQLAALISND